MDLKGKIERLKYTAPTAGSNKSEVDFNSGYDFAMREVLKLIGDTNTEHNEAVDRLPPAESGYDPIPGNEFYKQVVNTFAEVAYMRNNEYNKSISEDEVVKLITDLGGKLTSTFHPEGDTYTLITHKHFSISQIYKMVDVWNIGDYPIKRSLGRAWYKDIEGLKQILETGQIIDQRFD